MTNKKQRALLKVLCDNCINGDSCLLSESAIINFCLAPKLVNDNNLTSLLKSLESDDYIDVVYSQRDSERVYCITLHQKGRNFKAEYARELKSLKNRLLLTVLCACVSYLVGRILILLFN